MHMNCSQCRHEFCWLCLGPWSDHGERTGGFYNCNVYKRKIDKGEIDEDEAKRQHARQSLERYMHYWQRWAEHDKARKTARSQLEKWETSSLEVLGERVATPPSQLRFVLDAWREVINCRRVLKWTYAVGYYTFDDTPAGKHDSETHAAKQFFEFTQRDAENALERMNHKVEKVLPGFLNEAAPVNLDEWATFKEEVMGLTDVTRTQFSKLVDFLEKGLDAGLKEYGGADPMDLGVEDAEDDGAAGPSKPPSGGDVTGPSRRVTRSAAKRVRPTGANNGKAPLEEEGMASSVEVRGGYWQCKACTYANDDLRGSACEMCGRPRRT
jgi:ariadne-1